MDRLRPMGTNSKPGIFPMPDTGGNLIRSLRAARLLLRARKLRSPDAPNPRIIKESRSTNQTATYHLYEPTSGSEKTFIMVYGLTLKGPQDHRLVNFARCFAESGIRVAVPDLPGLKSYRFDEKDVTILADLVATLAAEHGPPIGICAFSAGAGLTLVAAADPKLSSIVDPLLLFSPYYCLADLWNAILDLYDRTPTTDDQWDNFLWLKMVFAHRTLETLNLTPDEKAQLIDLLENYCIDPSLDGKRRFYQQVLHDRCPADLRPFLPDEQLLQKLSPRGKLGPLRSRVLILHDQYDPLVPPRHAQRIHDELRSRQPPASQEILITPLLSHVNPRTVWKVTHVFRLLHIFGEIFR